MWAIYTAFITEVFVKETLGEKHGAFLIEIKALKHGLTWQITKRFSDFIALKDSLQTYEVPLPPFPSRTVFPNLTPLFLHQRREVLQVFLETILQNPYISCQLEVLKFIEIPSLDQMKQCREQMELVTNDWLSNQCSSEICTIKRDNPMSYIGCRFNHTRSLCHDTVKLRKYVCQMHHYLAWVELCQYIPSHSIMLLQKYYPLGSLKDVIHSTSPMRVFVSKYNSPGHPLDIDDISLCGLENSILGYAPYLVTRYPRADLSLLPLRTLDIVSFGHVLFEMTYGFEPNSSHPKYIPPHTSSIVQGILRSIFHGKSHQYPTVKDLLAHPFFSTVIIDRDLYDPEQVKLTGGMKEVLRKVKGGHPADHPSRAELLARDSCAETDDGMGESMDSLAKIKYGRKISKKGKKEKSTLDKDQDGVNADESYRHTHHKPKRSTLVATMQSRYGLETKSTPTTPTFIHQERN
eukprot:Ihof_evm25s9 gene=Ihof_evmTU25s9